MRKLSYMEVNMILELVKRSMQESLANNDGDDMGIMEDTIKALTICEALVLEKIEEEKRRALNE